MPEEPLQPELYEQLLGAPFIALAATGPGSGRDVREYREPREERVVLEHDRTIRARTGDRVPVDLDVTARRLLEAGQHVEQRALAAPARPDEAHDLGLTHRQRDSGDGRELVEALGDPLQDQRVALHRGHAYLPCQCKSRFSTFRAAMSSRNPMIPMRKMPA